MSAETPSLEPTGGGNVATSGDDLGVSRPEELTVETILAAAPTRPTLLPPGVAGAVQEAVTGTWATVTVDATWSIDETRNAFFHVTGGAWKKIFNGSDGAFATLVTLASQARQTGRQMAFREEPDGLVHEIYLW